MEEEDRISNLPDYVLEHILSTLPLKEAVRTTLLSKRWRRINVCSTLPNLNFIDYFYNSGGHKRFKKKNRRLLNVVDKIILARSQSTLIIQKFFLQLPLFDNCISNYSLQLKVERWMECLPKPGLTTLDLCIFGSYVSRHYDFPLSMFAAVQSLQNLSLFSFRLTSLLSCGIVGFSLLRILRLKKVMLDNDVMQKLLMGSPLLEILDLQYIDGLKSLEVRGFCHLKRLAVNCNDIKEVQIDSANLEFLELRLPKDTITMATCAPYLRAFKFNGGTPTPIELYTKLELQRLQLPVDAWLLQFLSPCSLLETLSLLSCPSLHRFHLSIPLLALKTLHLYNLEDMTNFQIVAPNLQNVSIMVKRNLPFVELNASDKLEVVVYFYGVGQFNGLFADQLGCFNCSRAVNIFQVCSSETVVIPKEMRNKLSSPLYNTNYLKISERRASPGSLLFSDYMGYMLWLSPRATNLTIKDDDTEIVLEFLYEENTNTAVDSGSCPHCMLLPLKCWRHHLKEVKIQEFEGDETEKEAIKRFLWEEIESLSIKEKSFDPYSIYGGLYASYDQLFR